MNKFKLTPNQLKELRTAFNLFDKDHSGDITTEEWKNVLINLFPRISNNELMGLVLRFDESNDGKVEFDEFVNVMSQEFYRYHTDREIEEAFRFFDQDGSGSITNEEFAQAIKKIKISLPDNEIVEICSKIDINKDQRISIEEFKKLLREKQT